MPSYHDQDIRQILAETKVIAMIGTSSNWKRPSYFAMKYLQEKGYRVIPVNPRAAGDVILGEVCYESLSEIPDPFDMVDVFRNARSCPPLAKEAVRLKETKGVRTFWMQLGIISEEAAKIAEDGGLTVIMDRCPKIEFGRLNTELSWGGFNSRVITARRKKVSGA